MRVSVLTGVLLAVAYVQAQTPFSRIVGEVTGIDPGARRITLKTDAGALTAVTVDDSTLYLRVPPGEKDLKKAAKIAFTDISVGDRVLARSRQGQSGPALSVLVMTKAELAQKHQRDREEWLRRGVSGTVTSINPGAHEITISTPSLSGPRSTVIQAVEGVQYRRYAPDSARFSDAKPSSIAELKPGDRVRVLGNRSEDGTRIKAEEIVSGSFRTVVGTIGNVDTASGQIRLTDLQAKKPVTVHVSADTTMRRVPPEMAVLLSRMVSGRAGPGPAGGGQGPPPGGGPPHGEGPRNFDMQSMLERMPAVSLADFKAGDAILVSSTTGASQASVTAITLLAGVEPLLAAAPPSANGQQPVGGTWNFGDIGLPQ